MNERLHDIMMEATKDMPHCYYWPGEYVEKFAELIVQECCDLMQGFTFEEIATKVIKKNFGVEE